MKREGTTGSLTSAARWIISRSRGLMLAHAALSTLAAISEATLLVIVAQLGVDLTRNEVPSIQWLESIGVASTGTPVAVATIVIALTVLLTNLCVVTLVARLQTSTIANIRAEAHRAYATTSWTVQAQDALGELQNLLTSYAARASQAAMWLSVFVRSSLMVTILMASAVSLDPVTAFAGLALGVVFAAFLVPLLRRSKRSARAAALCEGEYAILLADYSSASLELKAFGLSTSFADSLDESARRAQGAQERSRRQALGVPEFYKGILLLCVAAAIGLAKPSPEAATSVGAIALLFVRALGQVSTAQAAVAGLIESSPYIHMVDKAIARYRASTDRTSGKSALPIARLDHLSFVDVSFTYDGEATVIRGLSLQLRHGFTVGIVGPSGAGKSTLLQLLLGLRPPSAGSILVNEHPIDSFDGEDLRRRIGFMPQQSWLVAGSVADNISFGRELAEDAVVAAARLAGIDQAIPGGVHANVGQRGGGGLSGGQRQRVGLARALAANPDLLVLDEPTSSLDETSERALREALRSLKGTMGVVLVTHRRALLGLCDEVYSLEAGTLTRVKDGDILGTTDRHAHMAKGSL